MVFGAQRVGKVVSAAGTINKIISNGSNTVLCHLFSSRLLAGLAGRSLAIFHQGDCFSFNIEKCRRGMFVELKFCGMWMLVPWCW